MPIYSEKFPNNKVANVMKLYEFGQQCQQTDHALLQPGLK